MISWIVWALLLLLQNAAFTAVSRARNSKSLLYHATAAVASNGVWFLSLAIAVDKLTEAKSQGLTTLGFVAIFYTLFTVIGSVAAHYLLMTKVEVAAVVNKPRKLALGSSGGGA